MQACGCAQVCNKYKEIPKKNEDINLRGGEHGRHLTKVNWEGACRRKGRGDVILFQFKNFKK